MPRIIFASRLEQNILLFFLTKTWVFLFHLVNSMMSEDLEICWFEKRADIQNRAILNATDHTTMIYLAPNQCVLISS